MLNDRIFAGKHDDKDSVLHRYLIALCRRIVADLRRRCPDIFVDVPLKPGEVAPEVTVNVKDALPLYRLAFASAAGAEKADVEQVIWIDGENELLVKTGDVRVVFRDGFALVGIPVFSEQSGPAEVVVSFATGRPGAPLGLIMATEEVPRGPSPVVEQWGDQLTAAAWKALIQIAGGIAAAAGVDDRHDILLPASLVLSTHGITVTPQARHQFDRRGQ